MGARKRMAVSAMGKSRFPRFLPSAAPAHAAGVIQAANFSALGNAALLVLKWAGLVAVGVSVLLVLFVAWHAALEVRNRRKGSPTPAGFGEGGA